MARHPLEKIFGMLEDCDCQDSKDPSRTIVEQSFETEEEALAHMARFARLVPGMPVYLLRADGTEVDCIFLSCKDVHALVVYYNKNTRELAGASLSPSGLRFRAAH